MTARSVLVAMATGARGTLASPPALAVTALIQIIVVGIMATLWRFATEANGGSLVGYSAPALVWYIVISEAAAMGYFSRLIEAIGDDIATGAVTAEMLRPTSVVGLRLATELGRGLPRAVVGLVVGATVAFTLVGPPPDTAAFLAAVPLVGVALAVNLASQHAFAGVAFWLRDVKSTWYLYQKVFFILGGMLLPLEILPDRLAAVARVLPWAAMAYAPARLGSGHVDPVQIALQFVWLIALIALASAVFAAGERRLQAVGA